MGILKDIGDAAANAVDSVQDALGFGDEKEEVQAEMGVDLGPETTAPVEEMAGAEAALNTYTVQSGDNLSKIAAQYGTTWQKIFEANRDKISDPDLIHPGQELVIPSE
jgi:nucleoid-associated protein YgaU